MARRDVAVTWALLAVLCGLAGASSPPARELLQADPKALELLTAVESQEAGFKAHAAKEPLVKAHLDFAEYVYLKSTLPDGARMSIALRSYGRVAEIDPKNALAHGRLQTITNVYEAWGKPVPK